MRHTRLDTGVRSINLGWSSSRLAPGIASQFTAYDVCVLCARLDSLTANIRRFQRGLHTRRARLQDEFTRTIEEMGVVDLENLVTTPSPANTTEEIPWVEQTIAGGFRIWQVLFLGGAVLLAISTKT